MAIKSICDISISTTLGSFDLLRVGDWMLADIQPSESRAVQTQQYLRSNFVRNFPRGNVSNSITFSQGIDHDSHTVARDYIFSHKAAIDSLISNGDATINFRASGQTHTLSDAVIQTVESVHGIEIHRTRARTFFTYTITGGEITTN